MDIRQQITDTIIAMLEKGVEAAEMPWKRLGMSGMPRNYTTGRTYTGVNVLLLWAAAAERGYASHDWMTFKQAQDIGAQVRKGAKGVLCIYFKMMEAKGRAPVERDEEGRLVPMLKPFWVFNVADIDNLPARDAIPASTFDPIEDAEQILSGSGAEISHGGDRAFYTRAQDRIVLPTREQFNRPVDYYAVALHELTHWTGADSRLNREFGKRFGDEAYAFEELVAELGSAFVMSDLGLSDYTLTGHASYIANWLRVLKSDKGAIITAAKHASAAHALIMSKRPGAESNETAAD